LPEILSGNACGTSVVEQTVAIHHDGPASGLWTIKAICASASVTRSKASSNGRPKVLHSWILPTQLYGLGARKKARDFRPGSTGTCFDAARITHVVLDAHVHPVACFHALDPEGDKWIF
jgi:hypothetical protein